MIMPLDQGSISLKYKVDDKGYIKLAMNALLVDNGERKILFDPGAADFLPLKLRREYGLEIPHPMEETLLSSDIRPEQITDVVFTHLHFDHASGGFKRVPGNIMKRFPNARYHVRREHYQYAIDPDPFEADSFCTGLLKYLDRIYWLEDWDQDWIEFDVINGHTRGMVVPVIHSEGEDICFLSDLAPMEIFLDPELWCGYDLDSGLLLSEKLNFLQGLSSKTRMILYHDTLKESVLY